MEQTLKITNVLSDPTRFHIYQYIVNIHQDVTVQEIADQFHIHPNVARLHLSKLEDVSMLKSQTKKTGKGGRPSRLYRTADDVIQLNFPFRDYQLLSKIAIQTMVSIGEEGKKALYVTGKKFGAEIISQEIAKSNQIGKEISFDEKLTILKNASTLGGLYPKIEISETKTNIYLQIFNCPFKEIAADETETVCNMHYEFLRGMFESLYNSVELVENENIFNGCKSCAYAAIVTN